MPRIVVVGAGFAGVWSALAAARLARQQGVGDRLEVIVVAPGPDLVLRPRLYQADPDRHRVPLDRLLTPVGVRHLRGTVAAIDPAARTVEVSAADGEQTLAWDQLVLASGSRIRRPDLPGLGAIHDVDSLEAARALEEHLADLPRHDHPGRWTAVVVGSGFTGLEVATELRSRLRRLAVRASPGEEPRVVLVERHHEVGPSLGPGPRDAILGQLSAAGVELHLGDTLQHHDGRTVTLGSGMRIDAGTVVWTVGMAANPLTAQLPGPRDPLGRLEVDELLRLPEAEDVLVAGDAAAATLEDGHTVPQSCQYAIPSGKTAGWNAAAAALGLLERLTPFRPGPYVTCLDLGDGGAVFTSGWDREVQLVGPEAKRLKASINELIRPEVEDPRALLAQADPAWVPAGLSVA